MGHAGQAKSTIVSSSGTHKGDYLLFDGLDKNRFSRLLREAYEEVTHYRKLARISSESNLNNRTPVPYNYARKYYSEPALEIELMSTVLRNIIGIDTDAIYKILKSHYKTESSDYLRHLSEDPY